MKRAIYLGLIAVLLLCLDEAAGQPIGAKFSPLLSQPAEHQNHSSGRAVVFRRDRDGLAGFLSKVTDDTLYLQTNMAEEKVSRQDISRVIADLERNRGRSGNYGMLLGIYFGNLIFWSAKNQPSSYFDSEDFSDSAAGTLLANLAFAGVGGLIGILAGAGPTEIAFDFRGEEEKALKEWRRLKKFSAQENYAKKLHLSTQIGYVFTRNTDRYKNLIQDAGGRVWDRHFVGTDFYDIEKASNLNLLRKLQLTLSVKDLGEIGSAMLWFGEPAIVAFYDNDTFVGNIAQSLSTTGYYIVGIYHPLRRHSKRNVLQLGLGLGFAKTNFVLEAAGYLKTPGSDRLSSAYTSTERAFSTMLFAEYRLYLSPGFSLGFIADYAFSGLKKAVPGLPEAGIPPQELTFGNGSIGVTIGLHL